MNRAQFLRELDEVEAALDTPHAMLACPYLVGGNTCASGCWSEPRCVTEEPIDGWETDVRRNADRCADWAAELAYEARGKHGIVKHARDIRRRALKLARP